ncbi:hypothetical protein EDC18_10843 [Natranaerovirga pectinivora]|uniref:DUF503 domain-containing protein n=1 Tax=Natranaerovirga pectinivora TaxID=682400 RepID=A0A4R3MI69_9FIRM|nr:DUF503 domain-containing protein [Natranaerovirga pectinivora]TCT13808.1 hypothetical protein EDC18_10843 [Natranaerovirga pectinivora]
MIVESCSINILIYDSYSLKDKRSVLKSILEKSRQKFNVSISEVGSQEIHNKAEIGISCVGNTNLICDQTICSVLEFIEGNYNVDIIKKDPWF